MVASSSDYSEWNIDDKWSSQEWKSGEILGARTVRPVGGQRVTPKTGKFVVGGGGVCSDTAAESNFSPKSLSFFAQGERPIAKDVGALKRCSAIHRQTFFNLVNVYVFNTGSICIHGTGFLRKFTFHQKV